MGQDEGDLHVHLNHSVWREDAQHEEDDEADGDADDEDGGGRLRDHSRHYLLLRRQRGDRPGRGGGGRRTWWEIRILTYLYTPLPSAVPLRFVIVEHPFRSAPVLSISSCRFQILLAFVSPPILLIFYCPHVLLFFLPPTVHISFYSFDLPSFQSL